MHPDIVTSDTVWDVMIRCPGTGKPVHTCLVYELGSWAVVELQPQRFWCSECGQRHEWRKADAWLHKPRHPAWWR